MAYPLKKISIHGFKSIKKLEDFELNNLSILVGPNGAGKSNFVQFFELLNNIVKLRLQYYIKKKGGAEQFVYMGSKVTKKVYIDLYFDVHSYSFNLVPTEKDSFIIESETIYYSKNNQLFTPNLIGYEESQLQSLTTNGPYEKWNQDVCSSISGWTVYHFHDTGDLADVKKIQAINNNEKLQPDAGNLAAFLYAMQKQHPESYNKILDIVKLVAPFIQEFKLRPIPGNEDNIQFEWLQKNSDFPFTARHLSDGTLRFICLVTALLQPNPPATIILDEPELGLHPYALARFADLVKIVSHKTQVIISTQSSQLLDHFEPEDIIVVDRNDDGESTFKRLAGEELKMWLEDYSLGEMWEKNVFGGRP
ncbi:MAG TPA: AAA family ATPase [bacterium]|nr:AAA family ATPase [bacterium]HPN44961.1 AAA family ATPase [bacterium]